MSVVVVCALIMVAAAAADPFQHEIVVDDANGVRLRWNLTETEIRMQMEARVSGFVAVGWSKAGLMTDSFVAFGSADQAPVELIITSKEPQSGVTLALDFPLRNTSCVTADGTTTMAFARALQNADRSIPTATKTNMIWALHTTQRSKAVHTSKGSFVVNLQSGVMERKPAVTSAGVVTGPWLPLAGLALVALLYGI